ELRVTTLASAQHEFGDLAVDGAFVYWLDRGTPDDEYKTSAVMKVPRAGGDAARLAAASGNLLHLAVDEAAVYWTSAGATELMKVPKAGGAPSALVRGLVSPGDVAVDRAMVYFTEAGWNGAVRKIDKASGRVSTIAEA